MIPPIVTVGSWGNDQLKVSATMALSWAKSAAGATATAFPGLGRREHEPGHALAGRAPTTARGPSQGPTGTISATPGRFAPTGLDFKRLKCVTLPP